jgi:gliding motility-associated-like protein
VSDGLSYSWTPVTGLSNPNIINPIATVNTTTTYRVTATIGSCSATDDVVVSTVPYPHADAGADKIACYNGTVQLNGDHDGSSFTWTPTSYLSDPTILNPMATPPRTTTYVLTSFDNRGCPKPGKDSVIVTVLPKVRAYAGRDTSVVVGQPLQLTGSGGVTYTWTPSTGLSNPNIFNPIGIYTSANDTIRYKLTVANSAGCIDSAFVTVRIFVVKPTIFVPTAFTPNNDGLNDVVRPICVGIKEIKFFSVYNRWGQLVFTTTIDRAGWDGRIDGRLQNSGVFVWMVSAVDYHGNKIFLKGTVALIR